MRDNSSPSDKILNFLPPILHWNCLIDGQSINLKELPQQVELLAQSLPLRNLNNTLFWTLVELRKSMGWNPLRCRNLLGWSWRSQIIGRELPKRNLFLLAKMLPVFAQRLGLGPAVKKPFIGVHLNSDSVDYRVQFIAFFYRICLLAWNRVLFVHVHLFVVVQAKVIHYLVCLGVYFAFLFARRLGYPSHSPVFEGNFLPVCDYDDAPIGSTELDLRLDSIPRSGLGCCT